MRQLIIIMLIGTVAGCSSDRPLAIVRHFSQDRATATSDARKKELREFLAGEETYLRAMDEPLTLTNNLAEYDSSCRFIFHPSFGGPIICVRFHEILGQPDRGILSIRILAQKVVDHHYEPAALIYSHQELLRTGDSQALLRYIKPLGCAPPASPMMVTLDGVNCSVEQALGPDIYDITVRNSPDVSDLRSWFRTAGVPEKFKELDPTFDIQQEIAVQRQFLDAMEWLARRTKLWPLDDYIKMTKSHPNKAPDATR